VKRVVYENCSRQRPITIWIKPTVAGDAGQVPPGEDIARCSRTTPETDGRNRDTFTLLDRMQITTTYIVHALT
jgi:hypothetical protein